MKKETVIITAINVAIGLYILSSPNASSQISRPIPTGELIIKKESFHSAYVTDHTDFQYVVKSDIKVYPRGIISFRQDNMGPGSTHFDPVIVVSGDWTLEIIDDKSLEKN